MSEQDPRWQQLMNAGFRCSSCGQKHRGLMDLAIDHPGLWPSERVGEREPNSAVTGRTDVLTPDFCIIDGEDHFVRCVLRLPIVGLGLAGKEHVFSYGVWSSLSAANFQLYVDSFDSPRQGELGPWFGWFSNSLKGYPETTSLKCQVHPQNDGQRPFLELEPTDHPLSVEQREGVTLDRLFDIFALNGHDLLVGAEWN
ncbi:MAG TPA: DUF2199 domain-containing protein [Polyangia bacterium]|nr:DUF2199 domain-containing protein [Polyangia bacterium]